MRRERTWVEPTSGKRPIPARRRRSLHPCQAGPRSSEPPPPPPPPAAAGRRRRHGAPVSGLAKRVCSVATRKAPWTVSPTPPPIVIPSQSATFPHNQMGSSSPGSCSVSARHWMAKWMADDNVVKTRAIKCHVAVEAQEQQTCTWEMPSLSRLAIVLFSTYSS